MQELTEISNSMREGLTAHIKDRCVATGSAPGRSNVALETAATHARPGPDPRRRPIPARRHRPRNPDHRPSPARPTPPQPRRRTHRLRTYRKCFPGAAGAKWLVANGHAADEEAAVHLGNSMVQAGLLHHVAYEHTFKAGDLLYK
jgi:hypothetical protein